MASFGGQQHTYLAGRRDAVGGCGPVIIAQRRRGEKGKRRSIRMQSLCPYRRLLHYVSCAAHGADRPGRTKGMSRSCRRVPGHGRRSGGGSDTRGA